MDTKTLKTKSISSVFWKLSERLAAKLVSLVVSIILARLLTPSDYSVVGIVSIFFVFANVFISGGFNTALIQKKEVGVNDYCSVLYISTAIAALMYIILFFSAPKISPYITTVSITFAMTGPSRPSRMARCSSVKFILYSMSDSSFLFSVFIPGEIVVFSTGYYLYFTIFLKKLQWNSPFFLSLFPFAKVLLDFPLNIPQKYAIMKAETKRT